MIFSVTQPSAISWVSLGAHLSGCSCLACKLDHFSTFYRCYELNLISLSFYKNWMSIIYALVVRQDNNGSQVTLCNYDAARGNYPSITEQILKKITINDQCSYGYNQEYSFIHSDTHITSSDVRTLSLSVLLTAPLKSTQPLVSLKKSVKNSMINIPQRRSTSPSPLVWTLPSLKYSSSNSYNLHYPDPLQLQQQPW